MRISTVDIVKELRTLELEQNNLLSEAQGLVNSNRNRYHDLEQAEAQNIVSEEAVRLICLKYRLRALDIKLFKNEIPQEAWDRLAILERRFNVSLKEFKVVAPSELFDLEDPNKDPILLAELGEGKYVLVHKWGKEFNPLRKVMSWPFRNVITMFISITVLAMAFTTLLMPFVMDITASVFFAGFFAIWMAFIGMCIYLVFAFGIHPSSLNWDSREIDT